MDTTDSANNTTFGNSEISLPRPVRFWLLLFSDAPSITCSLLLLHYLIHDRTARTALNNHVIILLLSLGLTTQLIEIPFYLSFIGNNGVVKPSVPATCLAWWFVSFGMYNGGTILMAWAAVERHILVFNYKLISTSRGRFFVHYLPIGILLLYVFVFYIYVLFFFPCEMNYEYSVPICGAYPCYQQDPFVGMWEFIVNNIVPSLLVAVFSMVLLIRVVRQKRRLNQRVQWGKQRKMTIQLVSLSALNIVFNIPLNLMSLARLCGLPDDYGVDVQQYFYFSCYFLIFLFPFVCLTSYSEFCMKVKQTIFYCKVKPTSTSIRSAWVTNAKDH